MSSQAHPATPEVLWAQRPDKVFLTIQVHDVQQPTIQITPTHVSFEARGGGTGAGMESKWYKVDMALFKEIDTDKSTYVIAPRHVDFVLIKKESENWSRCLKDAGRPFWLKTDFSKFQDEDEEQEDPQDFMKSFGNYDFNSMGNSPMMQDSDDEDAEEEEEEEEHEALAGSSTTVVGDTSSTPSKTESNNQQQHESVAVSS